MDRESLRKTLCTLAKRVTGEAPRELSDGDSLLRDINLDSFSLVSLVLEIEELFDIALSDEEMQSSHTVGALLDLILKKLDKSPAQPTLSSPAIPTAPAAPNQIRTAVRAVGFADVPLSEIGAVRERLASEGRDARAQAVVRLCDEQNVLGVLAVKEAMRQGAIDPDEMEMWNLIAASRFLGRLSSVASWRRFRKLGPGRMSPLLIPFVSLHAGAGVLSLYFGIHGPTFGVSGCADNVSEGILTGLTTPLTAATPGTWLVFTGWEPEPVPDEKGATETPSRGYAVALALSEWNSQARMQAALEPAPPPCAAGEYISMRQFVEGVSRLDAAPCRLPLSVGGSLIIEALCPAQRIAA